MTVIINALGGPCSGKSTLSYGLMSLLKSRGHRAEYVPEYAKELVYRRDFTKLANQFEVTREQDRRLRDLLGQVDWIVHDTALPLGIIYAKPPFDEEWNVRRTWELYDGYENFTIFVKRVKAYEAYGRNQTEAEAVALDDQIKNLFGPSRINLTLEGKEGNEEEAYKALMALQH
jgi:hypothetical protein